MLLDVLHLGCGAPVPTAVRRLRDHLGHVLG